MLNSWSWVTHLLAIDVNDNRAGQVKKKQKPVFFHEFNVNAELFSYLFYFLFSSISRGLHRVGDRLNWKNWTHWRIFVIFFSSDSHELDGTINESHFSEKKTPVHSHRSHWIFREHLYDFFNELELQIAAEWPKERSSQNTPPRLIASILF